MMSCRAKLGTFLFVFFLATALGVFAQDPPAAPPKAPAQSDEPTKLTIEVTAGDKAEPVENASVYVKYIEQRTIRKDKKIELNVKTNREGITHVPDAPLGRALIQVIADGWKTYGDDYKIDSDSKEIVVKMKRPGEQYSLYGDSHTTPNNTAPKGESNSAKPSQQTPLPQ